MAQHQALRREELAEDVAVRSLPAKRTPGLLAPYISIARIDHWFKNVFMLFGVLLAFFIRPEVLAEQYAFDLIFALLAVCFVASSNYVLNEILDREFDAFHPEKCHRPIPAGQVSLPLAYLEWGVLALVGIGGCFAVNQA
ncbi:MAG: UbiA family prenyltransferase, partial [Bdellovibrionales bacterium]|nr:UbiA family prenyltransferase [Bdellovibrionales bacterium]